MIKHSVSWTVTIPLRSTGLQPMSVTECRQISKIYSLCTWRATVRTSTYHSPVVVRVLRSSNLRSANDERMMLRLMQARESAMYTRQQHYDKRLSLKAFCYDAMTVILAQLQIPGLLSRHVFTQSLTWLWSLNSKASLTRTYSHTWLSNTYDKHIFVDKKCRVKFRKSQNWWNVNCSKAVAHMLYV